MKVERTSTRPPRPPITLFNLATHGSMFAVRNLLPCSDQLDRYIEGLSPAEQEVFTVGAQLMTDRLLHMMQDTQLSAGECLHALRLAALVLLEDS